jgi:PAP_fibrillin
MTGDERFSLKTELLQRIEALGLQQAIFPSKEESIDEIVRQLEAINPIPRPLSADFVSCLLGEWKLIYASNGTVVTRPLASLTNYWGGIKIKRVWQTLTAGDLGKISACNAALFELPLLGEWRLQADGVWMCDTDEQVVKVSFDCFSVQATKLFSLSGWNLPELKVPVLELLRNQAKWTTSYLDEGLRVGRGATGNLFVFCL